MLSEQALALEGDRTDLERYAQVCEALSRAGTTYDDLDPEPWLTALEEESLPLSRRVDPAEQDTIAAAPYPGGGSLPGRWTSLWRESSGPSFSISSFTSTPSSTGIFPGRRASLDCW